MLFNNPNNTSGKPKNNAVNAAGIVNKFNPGINAVKNPLRMIGNNNNGAISKNGSPPKSARNNPTINAAIDAGIKLRIPLIKKLIGNAINLSINFVKNVPIAESNGKLIHVNGFKNANGPKIGANNNIAVNHTKNGITKLIIESTNIINGAKKIVSMIKLKNGIKLGNANNAKATIGSCDDNKSNPRIAVNPNAPSARINGNPKAQANPIAAKTSGNTTNVLNKPNNNSGNPIKLNNVN